jgi:hypothetical protein
MLTLAEFCRRSGYQRRLAQFYADRGVFRPLPDIGSDTPRRYDEFELDLARLLVPLQSAQIGLDTIVAMFDVLRGSMAPQAQGAGWSAPVNVQQTFLAARAGKPAWLAFTLYTRPGGQRGVDVTGIVDPAALGSLLTSLSDSALLMVLDLRASLAEPS